MRSRSKIFNLLTYTDRQNLTWTFAYDEDISNPPGGTHGRLRSMTTPDPDGPGPIQPITTNYDYSGSYNYLLVRRIINPDASFKEFAYGAWDVLESENNEIGVTTRYVRDLLNRVTEMTQGTVGPIYESTWTYEYGKNGQVIKQTDPLGKITTFTYDARYRMLTQTLPDPDGADWLPSPVYTWKYNPTGQVIEAHDPSYASGYKDLFEYDDTGRLIKHTGPLHTLYPTGQETVYQYDLLDRLIRTKDASGRVERWKYDIRGRLVEQFPSDPDDAGPLTGPSVKYSYDDASRLIAVRDELFRVKKGVRSQIGESSKLSRSASLTCVDRSRVKKGVRSEKRCQEPNWQE